MFILSCGLVDKWADSWGSFRKINRGDLDVITLCCQVRVLPQPRVEAMEQMMMTVVSRSLYPKQAEVEEAGHMRLSWSPCLEGNSQVNVIPFFRFS